MEEQQVRQDSSSSDESHSTVAVQYRVAAGRCSWRQTSQTWTLTRRRKCASFLKLSKDNESQKVKGLRLWKPQLKWIGTQFEQNSRRCSETESTLKVLKHGTRSSMRKRRQSCSNKSSYWQTKNKSSCRWRHRCGRWVQQLKVHE